MIISFAKTKEQIRYRLKTVTRRYWKPSYLAQWQRAWDEGRHEHDAYDKSPRVDGQKIGTIVLTERPYTERLGDITKGELIAEGFPKMKKRDFYALIGGHRNDTVSVIRFEVTPDFEIEHWSGCFDRSGQRTKDLPPNSYQHPAKMSIPLLYAIYNEIEERQLIDTTHVRVADPFGGVGTTAAVLCRRGFDVDIYEVTPAYAVEVSGMYCAGIHRQEMWDAIKNDPVFHCATTVCPACVTAVNTRADESLLGYEIGAHHYAGLADLLGFEVGILGRNYGRLHTYLADSRTLAHIAPAKYDLVITSPPYEDVIAGVGTGPSARFDYENHSPDNAQKQSAPNYYAAGEGQLGALSGEEYDREITAVYDQCQQAMRPGALIVVNVKDFIRDGQIVNMEGKTIMLLDRAGFRLEFVARANLIENLRQLSFIEGHTGTIAYESVHRRSYRKKHGFGIDYESVIFARRP